MSAQLNPQRAPKAQTSLGESAYRWEPVYVDPLIVGFPAPQLSGQGTATVFFQGSYSSYVRATQVPPWLDLDVTVALSHQPAQIEAKEFIRCLAESLCLEHPAISTYEGIFGGAPHIKGVRLSVGDVLSELYLLGSVDAVAQTYSVDKEQVKEAIAYAQDFLESAVSS
jgi:uncharacterized protein (DUF433 family)